MKTLSTKALTLLFALLYLATIRAQDMSFQEYDPPSTMVVSEHN